MNITAITMDERQDETQTHPGARLAAVRLQKGYTPEYVAGKLHLRVRIIELLEANDYHHLPEPVFIKGYLRAYAKLLDIAPEPFLEQFHATYKPLKTNEKTLWQSRRETNRAEHAIRWLTGFFAAIVLIAVALWWHTNKGNEPLFTAAESEKVTASNTTETEIRLTDLSKMRSLLTPQPIQNTLVEKESA